MLLSSVLLIHSQDTDSAFCLLLKSLTLYGAKTSSNWGGWRWRQGETDARGSMCVVLSESAEGQVLNTRMDSIARPSIVHPHESHKVERKVFKLSCFMQQVLSCAQSQDKKEQFSMIAPPLGLSSLWMCLECLLRVKFCVLNQILRSTLKFGDLWCVKASKLHTYPSRWQRGRTNVKDISMISDLWQMKVAKHSLVCSLERRVCLKGQNLNPFQLENDAQRFKEIAEKTLFSLLSSFAVQKKRKNGRKKIIINYNFRLKYRSVTAAVPNNWMTNQQQAKKWKNRLKRSLFWCFSA